MHLTATLNCQQFFDCYAKYITAPKVKVIEIGSQDVNGNLRGCIIILDDYEMLYYRAQKIAEDDWFGKRGYKVFPLPTSQAIVIKR